MPDITQTERKFGMTNILGKYDTLISRFPLERFSVTPLEKYSFPEGPVTDQEREWANSLLNLSDNKELLIFFGKAIGHVGSRGLQLLRDQSNKNREDTVASIKANLTAHSLLALLRNEFQSNALFYEEGLRGSRDIDDDYWLGEGDQLDVGLQWLRLSRNAFKEMDNFEEGRIKKLNATKLWLEENFNAVRSAADHNESFFRERGDEISRDDIVQSARRDSEELVFWSSLKGFIDNLELTRK